MTTTPPSTSTTYRVQNCKISPGTQCLLAFILVPGDYVSGLISVSGGSGRDVNFWVTDPSGATVYNAGRVTASTDFSFTAAQGGTYTLHLDNSFSIITGKQVTVSYNVGTLLLPGGSSGTGYLMLAVILGLAALVLVLLAVVWRKRGQIRPPPATQPAF